MKMVAQVRAVVAVPFDYEIPDPPGGDYPPLTDRSIRDRAVELVESGKHPDGADALEAARDAIQQERDRHDRQRDAVRAARVGAARHAKGEVAKAISDLLGGHGEVVDVIIEEVRNAEDQP